MGKRSQVIKQVRPAGHVILDLEPLLEELLFDHDMQWGDVLALVHQYMEVHAPGQRETYVADGEHPEFYYGPKRKKGG